jgi:biopolymer transport protein ExbB/TolQ
MNASFARLIVGAYTQRNTKGRSPLDIPKRSIWLCFLAALIITLVTGNLLMWALYSHAEHRLANSVLELPKMEDITTNNCLRTFLPEIKSRLPESAAALPQYDQLFDSSGNITFKRYVVFAAACIKSEPKPTAQDIQKSVMGTLVYPWQCLEQPDLFTQMEKWGFTKPLEDPEGVFSQDMVDYYTLFKATTKFRDQLGGSGELTQSHRLLRLLGGSIQWATYLVFWWCLLLLLLRGQMAKTQMHLVTEGQLPQDDKNRQIWQVVPDAGEVPYFSTLKKSVPGVLLPAELMQDTLKEIALNPERGRIEPFMNERVGNWRGKVAESGYELINFLSNSIPSLGFVGTVLGIIAAMGAADMIISVKDPVFQVESMNIITNSLSVAFDTTAVSLLLALVIGYINANVKKQESDFFERLESEAGRQLKKIWNERKTEPVNPSSIQPEER